MVFLFNPKKFFESVKDIILFSFVISLFFALILNQDFYLLNAKKGIYFCNNVLIPSLFPFIFLSSFILKSNISNLLEKIFSPISEFLFYLPASTTTSILLGLISGYPTGAKNAKILLDKGLINSEQANRLTCFSFGAGPGFIICLVGKILLKDIKLGTVVFISQVLSSVILGMLLGIKARISKETLYTNKIFDQNNKKTNILSTVVESTIDSANSVLNMCFLVVIFYSFIPIINLFFKNLGVFSAYLEKLVSIFLEINFACTYLVNSKYPSVFIAFALGWGGLCVHLQILSLFSKKDNFNIYKFMMFRFFHAIINSFFIWVFNYKISSLVETTAKQSINPDFFIFSSSFSGSFSFILVLICFLSFIFDSFLKKYTVDKID